jgi:hypothetical protein
MEKKKDEQEMNLQVTDGLTVAVIPDLNHEFLMPTKDVAKGYGVSSETIRGHQHRNSDDFSEGKHFIKGVSISNTLRKNAQPHQIYFTKRGIVRLGFFIKSERARMFRDWAEDLIIHRLDEFSKNLEGVDVPPYVSDILYEFETRVRTKLINDETWYKVRDVSLLCKVTHTSHVFRKLPSLDNFVKITPDFWNIAEWWCNREGLRQFLGCYRNPNFIRLHDALFSKQLSLMSGKGGLL